MVLKQAAVAKERRRIARTNQSRSWDLDEAYNRCTELALTDLCTAGLGTSPNNLLNLGITSLVKSASVVFNLEEQNQLKASGALYAWCRRTDELVDGINGCCATPEVLDRWEQRLIDLYEGRPHDIYDAALSHTLSKYPIDLQLFKDLIEGMRMDLSKKRYENFDELYLYIYRIAGAPFTMLVQLTCKEHKESLYNAALAFAMSGQLTDIMRDVVEDARMGRIYLPQDELARAGLSEEDIYEGQFTSNEWRNYMKEQIKRARSYADEGDRCLHEMSLVHRLGAVVLSLSTRHILDTIEANDYNLSKPTPVILSQLLPAHIVSCGKTILEAKFPFP